MDRIHVIARFKIQEGKLEEFKEGADKCVQTTQNEPGALLYDWFIDEENLICTVIETYKNSEATMAHLGNIQEPLSHLLTMSDFSGEVFGNASDELKDALMGLNVIPVPFFAEI